MLFTIQKDHTKTVHFIQHFWPQTQDLLLSFTRMSLQDLINRSDSQQNSSNVTLLPIDTCTSTTTSQATVISKSIAYSIILCVSLIGNILVVFVIYKNRSMRTTVNYFIVNMALSDLIIPILVLPLRISNVTSSREWRVHGTIGAFLCKFVYFISDITPTVSSVSLVLMTFDRFCAVAFPMKAALIPARYRVVLIAFSWVVTMAFFAPYFYAFNLMKNGNMWICMPTWPNYSHKIFTILACVLFIILPFVLLIILYTAILVILRRNRGAGEELEMQRKRRAKINISVIKLALTIVIVFAVCWGPLNAVLFVLTLWDYNVPANLRCALPTIIDVVQFLAYSNPAINPLIYFILNENYRTGLKRAITKTIHGRNAVIESSGLGIHSAQHSRNVNHFTKEIRMTLLRSPRGSSS
ncbi:QRFP-like peptide receptor [Actinia tenebrosa]|uniref:QRFP-like peptide receptor n=1 Tax=Actinia tenebrosa TaxID=6105 RepID=A0A6P8HDZ2_ACTTE|nr:QRFP-like peptide receptor [Actinia tenebrosa]